MDEYLKVLFVERDPAISASVADAFMGMDDIVLMVAGGFELAEPLLMHGSIDVLVVDVRIPETGNGHEFVHRFANRYLYAGIVLVCGDPQTFDHFYPPYAVCLQKPYNIVGLLDAIESAMRLARSINSTHPRLP